MALSWNEIKSRAVTFSKEWENEISEDAEAKTFLDDFFNVFGIDRRRVASFETKVKTLGDKTGYVDMLWKGQILIEMKSRGKNLDRAYKQATDYFAGLTEIELPKYILVCDFQHFRLYDLEEDTEHHFELKELYKNVKLFGFIAGYQKTTYKPEDPVNVKAAELMGELHDELKAVGYSGHQLELYLVRILFCLFADDTTIFAPYIFQEFIANKTRPDGSDVGAQLAQLFQVLNTPNDKRMRSLDEDIARFPYVNGKLFEEPLQLASWNSHMRNALLKCCALNWGAISPAIFGSMFQSVMDEKARRNLGAHYTSETNILKLIKPLFLDELWAEFEKVKHDNKKLQNLHKKLAALKFLDPACGCGNFLVISYRELRLLELEVIKALQKGQQVTNIEHLVRIDVDQFYGIEYEEFPAQIAQVAMWLMDHQMNMVVMEAFGKYVSRIPLKKSAAIVNGNALHIEWQSLLNPVNSLTVYAQIANVDKIDSVAEPVVHYKNVNVIANDVTYHKTIDIKPGEPDSYFNYILGNPPFVGKSLMNEEQKNDVDRVFLKVNGSGVLDYVTCWYIKAAQYLQHYNNDHLKIKCAFVSTNSISQGEQVGALWNELFTKYHIKIHFAHRTFSWNNEAKGNAAVHVVIIGFSNFDVNEKYIFEYENIKGEAHQVRVSNINPYLVDGKDFVIRAITNPICDVPKMMYGNKIVDGGNYLFTDEEKKDFIQNEPDSKRFFRKILSGDEFINGHLRWVLYLKDIAPNELRSLPKIYERVLAVKAYRAKSPKSQTKESALTPTLFTEPRQPKSDFLLIPRTSSENRRYIPFGFFTKDYGNYRMLGQEINVTFATPEFGGFIS